MTFKTDIGGCLPLECGRTPFYHRNALLLNSGRNALRLVLRKLHIDRLFVPAFTCPVVIRAVKAENITPVFYDLNDDLTPKTLPPEDDFLLMNDRFGVTSSTVAAVVARHPKTIVDAAQAFFAPPTGVASVYSPRKFFGVPDGGAVVSDMLTPDDLPESRDFSYDRSTHLLVAADLGSDKADPDFIQDEKALNGFDIMRLSRLTERLLGNIDYDFVRSRRSDNFKTLHAVLRKTNRLSITLTPNDVPMFYPYLVENPLTVRRNLLRRGIDTPIYWPETESVCAEHPHSLFLCKNIVPVPCDQRYGKTEMMHILDVLAGA